MIGVLGRRLKIPRSAALAFSVSIAVAAAVLAVPSTAKSPSEQLRLASGDETALRTQVELARRLLSVVNMGLGYVEPRTVAYAPVLEAAVALRRSAAGLSDTTRRGVVRDWLNTSAPTDTGTLAYQIWLGHFLGPFDTRSLRRLDTLAGKALRHITRLRSSLGRLRAAYLILDSGLSRSAGETVGLFCSIPEPKPESSLDVWGLWWSYRSECSAHAPDSAVLITTRRLRRFEHDSVRMPVSPALLSGITTVERLRSSGWAVDAPALAQARRRIRAWSTSLHATDLIEGGPTLLRVASIANSGLEISPAATSVLTSILGWRGAWLPVSPAGDAGWSLALAAAAESSLSSVVLASPWSPPSAPTPAEIPAVGQVRRLSPTEVARLADFYAKGPSIVRATIGPLLLHDPTLCTGPLGGILRQMSADKTFSLVGASKAYIALAERRCGLISDDTLFLTVPKPSATAQTTFSVWLAHQLDCAGVRGVRPTVAARRAAAHTLIEAAGRHLRNGTDSLFATYFGERTLGPVADILRACS